MRDTIAPEQMAMWRAFRTIQPDIGDRICEILKIGFAAVANSMGAKYEPDDFEPCPDKKRPAPVMGPAQIAARVRGKRG